MNDGRDYYKNNNNIKLMVSCIFFGENWFIGDIVLRQAYELEKIAEKSKCQCSKSCSYQRVEQDGTTNSCCNKVKASVPDNAKETAARQRLHNEYTIKETANDCYARGDRVAENERQSLECPGVLGPLNTEAVEIPKEQWTWKSTCSNMCIACSRYDPDREDSAIIDECLCSASFELLVELPQRTAVERFLNPDDSDEYSYSSDSDSTSFDDPPERYKKKRPPRNRKNVSNNKRKRY